jgi:hypothetical protein
MFNVVGVRALLIVIISRIEDTKETPSRARIGSNDDNEAHRGSDTVFYILI